LRGKHTSIICSSTVLVLALAMAMVAAPVGAAAGATPAAAPTTYYLALGDSLSTGGGATPGESYVDDVYAHEEAIIPGLQLENLGCAGDSTTRMIHGGLCKTYTTGNQLGDAEAFLASHAGAVRFVTIDIGGDDVDGCAPEGVINSACIQKGLQAVATNMQTILEGLRAAGGDVPIVGMTYYDPWLAYYLSGADGQQTATASLALLYDLNSELRSAYKQYHARIAPVQKAFDSWDMALTGSFNGQTVPQDVANICNWTHMCDPTNPTVHTNDTGHALLATAFESRLKRVR
jgi:lysophospholipase L1-like esterase